MPWILLFCAIAAEVVATSALKFSDGLTRLVPVLVVGAGYLLSFSLLAIAVKSLEISVAYAMWSRLGTAAICVIGLLAFNEPITAQKGFGILLIIAGVVTLNLTSRTA